jgi:hypothetical protein
MVISPSDVSSSTDMIGSAMEERVAKNVEGSCDWALRPVYFTASFGSVAGHVNHCPLPTAHSPCILSPILRSILLGNVLQRALSSSEDAM